MDECNGNHSCHENATCTNSDGSYDCHCISGFIGTGFNCSSTLLSLMYAIVDFSVFLVSDIDECGDSNLNNCSEIANCTDTVGSYECMCSEGYTGDGFSCEGMHKINFITDLTLTHRY